jgi:hypothetical protein
MYKFKFKRRWFFKTIKVIGHRYQQENDKMTLFTVNGGIHEVPNWKDCECILGKDWEQAVKEAAAGSK